MKPTPEQYLEFGQHLCAAHSWYKHLPLMTGACFVVFVAKDAGFGRMEVVLDPRDKSLRVRDSESPEYTNENPRLHHTWQTTAEYRRRFGFLDYQWRIGPGFRFNRDSGPVVQLPKRVQDGCGFTLYPYASGEFAEALTWKGLHDAAIAQLRAGAAHPAREEILQLAQDVKVQDAIWANLNERDKELVLGQEIGRIRPHRDAATPYVREYFDIAERVEAIAGRLIDVELAKVKQALVRLDAMLDDGWPGV